MKIARITLDKMDVDDLSELLSELIDALGQKGAALVVVLNEDEAMGTVSPENALSMLEKAKERMQRVAKDPEQELH